MATKTAGRLPTIEVAKLFGVDRKTVTTWVERGILRPAGHGVYLYNAIDLLSFGLAIDLRRRGFSLDQCVIVAKWLRGKGVRELRTEWQRGQHYLLSIGDNEPFHRQFSHGEIFENEHIDLPAAFALGLPIAVIDVRAAHEILQHKLANSSMGVVQ